MILYFDLDTQKLVQPPGVSGEIRSYSFTRGDYTPLEAHFLSAGEEVTNITEIVFILKTGPGSGVASLAIADEWENPEDTTYFTALLNLNGETLDGLIGSLTSKDFKCQISCHHDGNGPLTSQLITATVGGDLHRGDEDTPLELPDPEEWLEETLHAATSKTTPVDADEIPLVDSAASWVLKKLTWANLKATVKTYFDTLYDASGLAAAAQAHAIQRVNHTGTQAHTTITGLGTAATATLGTAGSASEGQVIVAGPGGIISANVRINTGSGFTITDPTEGFKTILLGSSLSSGDRTITFPDASGTVALTSDIPSLSGYQTTAGTLALGGFSSITGTIAISNVSGLQAAIDAKQAILTGVVVTKANGARTAYPPSADTDTARGIALEVAFAAAVAGDTIDLSPGNYLITKAYSGAMFGGLVADFAILDKMTIRLNGARLYRTTPATVTAGSFVIGRHYTILTAGTTNYVSEQGAANNNATTTFVAIAAGTGTGTAILTPPVMFSVAFVTGSMGGSNWALLGPGIIEGTAATTTTTGYANEIGLNVGASRAWKIDGVSFLKFRGVGLQLNSATYTGDPTGYSTTYKSSSGHVSNCNFDLNNVGMGCYQSNEFVAFTNCSFNQNLTAADVYAGNTKFVGCEIIGNTNFGMRIRNGGNDGHGCFVGGAIAHNAGFAVSAEASMDNGFIFSGTIFGADSTTTNKIQSLGGGLTFVGCYMESPFFASGTPTGNNFMSNCFIAGTYTVHTDLSTAERLKWKFVNNQTLTGPWASNDAYAYVYADNAAALAGGLLAGETYRTSTGETRIVY